MGKKWSTIQAKLNRSADSCRDKYREMSEEFVKGRWKDDETELLKKIMREYLGANPDADMLSLGKLVEEQDIQVPWSTVSKKIGNRSRLSCFKKWQKMTGQTNNNEDSSSDSKEKRRARSTTDKRGAKRIKTEQSSGNDDDVYRAKMAAETVEAVELPDTVTLSVRARKSKVAK